MRLVFLNTSIITSEGQFNYDGIDLKQAMLLVGEAKENDYEILSAIGHESTAQILSDLLGYPVKCNRIEYKQEVGDLALVFKMNGRPEEGKVFTRDEIEKVGYRFGLLTKNAAN